jgi:hypothetical protein
MAAGAERRDSGVFDFQAGWVGVAGATLTVLTGEHRTSNIEP